MWSGVSHRCHTCPVQAHFHHLQSHCWPQTAPIQCTPSDLFCLTPNLSCKHIMQAHLLVSHTLTSLSYEDVTNRPVSTGYQVTPAV